MSLREQYTDEDLTMLEDENAELREEVERLRAGQAPAAPAAPVLDAGAEWKARYASAQSPEEVLAIRAAEEAAGRPAPLSDAEADAAVAEYNQALLALDQSDPNYFARAQELHMAHRARLGDVV